MENLPPQFFASNLSGGAVSKDGESVTIEFESGERRLWVTLPVSVLPKLQAIKQELNVLAIDARNGVARQWHGPPTKT